MNLRTAAILLLGVILTSCSEKPTQNATDGLNRYTVQRGDLPITVVVRGSLESQNTDELICEVEPFGSEYAATGTQILFIVPNGAEVKKGDLLVELDDTLFTKRLIAQRVAAQWPRSQHHQATARLENGKEQNEADLAEAKQQVALAELALKAYGDAEGGRYQLELQDLDQRIKVAEEVSRIRATDLERVDKLKQQGECSEEDVSRAGVAAIEADLEVAQAVSARKMFVDHTHRKTKTQLEGDLATAKRAVAKVGAFNKIRLLEAETSKAAAAQLEAAENERLGRSEENAAKCKIYAPTDGMVMHEVDDNHVKHIAEGAFVHQRQKILTMPDLGYMQVRADVPETKIAAIRPGLKATVKVVAFPGLTYEGSVKTVAVLPRPGERKGTDAKFPAVVTIDETVKELRPGMTAEVEIHIEQLRDVLAVPVQAIVHHDQKPHCYVEVDGRVERREVTVGKTNDEFVEIRDGLRSEDRVILDPI